MPDGDSESQSAYEDIREACEDHLKHLWNTWAQLIISLALFELK